MRKEQWFTDVKSNKVFRRWQAKQYKTKMIIYLPIFFFFTEVLLVISSFCYVSKENNRQTGILKKEFFLSFTEYKINIYHSLYVYIYI